MKAFTALSYRGQVLRLRRLAEAVLPAYNLADARLTFIAHAENTTFRADASMRSKSPKRDGPYRADSYLLRVHRPGRHGPHVDSRQFIASELAWLTALRLDTTLNVPEPIRAINGEYTTVGYAPGIAQPRVCSVLKWLNGRRYGQSPTPLHLQRAGALMAQLHNHAATWSIPNDFQRIRWDWHALFGDTLGFGGLTADETWKLIPDVHRHVLEQASAQIRGVMEQLGTSPDVFGLIHADLHLDNLLFDEHEARPIDFDDCGFGYWIYDIAVPLWLLRMEAQWPSYQAAFLKGYAQFRTVPQDQLAYLDSFIAAREAIVALWQIAMAQSNPAFRERLDDNLNYSAKMIARIKL